MFLCIFYVLLCFNGTARPCKGKVQFFHHMLSHKASSLAIQTLICHHSHSNFILCAWFLLRERLYSLFPYFFCCWCCCFFFFLLLFFSVWFFIDEKSSFYPSNFGFVRFLCVSMLPQYCLFFYYVEAR